MEAQEKGATVLYVVTEAVKPLAIVLQELALTGHHKCVCVLAVAGG